MTEQAGHALDNSKPDTEPSFPTAAFREGHSPTICPITPQVCGVKNIGASLISNRKIKHRSASSGRPQ